MLLLFIFFTLIPLFSTVWLSYFLGKHFHLFTRIRTIKWANVLFMIQLRVKLDTVRFTYHFIDWRISTGKASAQSEILRPFQEQFLSLPASKYYMSFEQSSSNKSDPKWSSFILFEPFCIDRITIICHCIVTKHTWSETPCSVHVRQLLSVCNATANDRNRIHTKW